MLHRATRALMWLWAGLTLLFAAAFALNFAVNISYSARPIEVALYHHHLVVMRRDPRDVALKDQTFGWIVNGPAYINTPGVQHWATSAPWGTGTAVPLWTPLAMSAFMTAAFFAQTLRRPRRPGACAACGYDRRGLAPGAACPECGKAA